jgi:4-hydroxybutyryl-CoA dehydratase/vinylacetyl-CoA-Delta-isomerase
MLMSATEYRESLRRYHPSVFVDGRQVTSVADEPLLAPGINGIGVSYDFALRESTQALMRAHVAGFDGPINRMLAIPRNSADLLNKLEAVRVLCQETGCAQRYLAGDALAAIYTARIGSMRKKAPLSSAASRLLDHVYANDHVLASRDRRQGRSLAAPRIAVARRHGHIIERRADGIRAPRRSSPPRPMCTSCYHARRP